MSATATDDALRVLAEHVYGDAIPAGIAPAVVLSNWNEAPERVHGEVLAAFDAVLAQIDTRLAVLRVS